MNKLNPTVRRRQLAGFDMEVGALAVNAHLALGDPQHALYARNGRQSRPFKQADGVEYGVTVENPARRIVALALIQRAAPAGIFIQPQRGQR